MPVAHGEGNYEADEETLKRLEGEGGCSPLLLGWGEVGDAFTSTVRRTDRRHRQRARQCGMMPHPENHVEDIMGCTDGRGLFAGLVAHLSAA